MRGWLVVLKDGTRVKVRAAYQDSDGEDVFFVDDKGYTVAVFTPHTVAYYFDAASCAVIVDGPTTTDTGCGICNDPNCKDPSGQH